MILVTSAAGNTGRIIVQRLVDAGFDVLATDIDPKVKDLNGIKDAMVGDLTDLSFINALMEKATKVVYIPPLFLAQEALIGKRMIDSAQEHGIEYFLFVSVVHPILSTLLQHTAKREVEEYLVYKGMETQLPYTILQPMHYMHNFNPKVVAESDKYSIFYNIDTKVGYVATEDVADVVIKIFSEGKKHDKATYELVGTPAYSPNDLIDMFNDVTGKKAVTEYVDAETFLKQIQANDLFFQAAVKQLAYTYSTWGLDGNSNVLTWLLGHEPTTFKDYVKKSLAK